MDELQGKPVASSRYRHLGQDIMINLWPVNSAQGMRAGMMPRGVSVSHLPTAITVTCDVHRHQHENRKLALEKLKAILVAINFHFDESDLLESL